MFSVLLDTPFTIVKGNVENIPACNSALNLLSPNLVFVKNILEQSDTLQTHYRNTDHMQEEE